MEVKVLYLCCRMVEPTWVMFTPYIAPSVLLILSMTPHPDMLAELTPWGNIDRVKAVRTFWPPFPVSREVPQTKDWA